MSSPEWRVGCARRSTSWTSSPLPSVRTRDGTPPEPRQTRLEISMPLVTALAGIRRSLEHGCRPHALGRGADGGCEESVLTAGCVDLELAGESQRIDYAAISLALVGNILIDGRCDA